MLRGRSASSRSRAWAEGLGRAAGLRGLSASRSAPGEARRSARSLPPSVASPGQEGTWLGKHSPREASPKLTTALSRDKTGETVTRNKVRFFLLEREFAASCKARSPSDVNEKRTLTPVLRVWNPRNRLSAEPSCFVPLRARAGVGPPGAQGRWTPLTGSPRSGA